MKIIRDEELFGLAMIPLLVDWGVRRCNVKGCISKPNTIVTQLAPDVPIAGFCEKHHQESKAKGEINYTLVFDDYDALSSKKAEGL